MAGVFLHDGIADRVYEIDAAGALLHATSLPPRTRTRRRGERCHDVFWRRTSPCLNCPFLRRPPASDDRPRSGIIATATSGRPVLVVGRRVSAERIRLAQYELEGGLFGQFLSSRIDTLAGDSKLSSREQEVLHHLLHGRSLKEIAVALSITVRTAKYHQANVLTKLGAASRYDVLRLIATGGKAGGGTH